MTKPIPEEFKALRQLGRGIDMANRLAPSERKRVLIWLAQRAQDDLRKRTADGHH